MEFELSTQHSMDNTSTYSIPCQVVKGGEWSELSQSVSKTAGTSGAAGNGGADQFLATCAKS